MVGGGGVQDFRDRDSMSVHGLKSITDTLMWSPYVFKLKYDTVAHFVKL